MDTYAIHNGEGCFILKSEMVNYIFDEEFMDLHQKYLYTKLWGLPNGGGWANENQLFMDSITIMELEQRSIESESMKHGTKR